DSRGASEVGIFRLFTRTVSYPADPTSIQSRPEPEPDIRCEVRRVGAGAFEVTEGVDPALAQQIGDQQCLKTVFHEEYDRLPAAHRRELENGLGKALIDS